MMSWSIGFDEKWNRDIGYGVPAICDHLDCNKEIDRGLSYVCGNGEPYGGDEGCGLYFCEEHGGGKFCERCKLFFKDGVFNEYQDVDFFQPKPDTQEWIDHKNTHESWKEWRKECPDEVWKLKQTEE